MRSGLKEIIPRFFIFGFGDQKPKGSIDPSLFEWLKIGISGYEFQSRNVVDPFQILNTINLIKENSKIFPFLMAGQEGGTVTQFVSGFTTGLNPMGLTATNEPENARVMAEKIGKELRIVGINTVLSPVLDTNIEPQNPIIGIRSFSDDPKIVAEMGKKICEGFHSNGLLTTGKHFPGHGGTKEDSHLTLPIIEAELEEFRENHLYPFAELIKDVDLDLLMTAHVMFPRIDQKCATLSKVILTDIARKELNFDGLIITDCLEMNATKNYGIEKTTVEAFNAGADLILLAHTPSLQKRAIEALQKAVEDGYVSTKKVQESLLRIEEKRQKLVDSRSFEEIKNYFITRDDNFDVELAKMSIYLHKNEGILPIKKDSKIILLHINQLSTELDELNLSDPIVEKITENFELSHSFSMSYRSTMEEFKKVEKYFEECDVVILITRSRGSKQIESINPVLNRIDAEKIVLIAGRDPYDLFSLNYNAGIATFGMMPQNVKALCELLSGTLKPTATFPLKKMKNEEV